MEKEKSFAELLNEAQKKIIELNLMKDFAEMPTEWLLKDIFKIGVALYRKPELKESVAFKNFYENSWRAALGAHFSVIQIPRYFRDIVREQLARDWDFYGYSDEYCQTMRSAIAFLIDIFGYEDYMEEILEDIDEIMLKRHSLFELTEDPTMPASHWWWHYPKE